MRDVYDVLRYSNLGLLALCLGYCVLLAWDRDHEWTFNARVIFGILAARFLNDIYSTVDLLTKGVPSGFRNLSQFTINLLLLLALMGVQTIVRHRIRKSTS